MIALNRNTFILILLPAFLFACNTKKDRKLFELLDGTGIDFTNTVQNTKDFNIFTYRNFYNGGGVAIGDINNDGLADVFMTSNMGSNKLYLNKGNFKFEDISRKAGITEKGKWNTGVVMVDINADGWLDIYVCNAGLEKWSSGEGNRLFINNQDLSFTEKAKEYGLDEKGYSTHAAFFDYDLDGDLDCYILNNSFIPVNTLNYSNKRTLRAKDWPVEEFLKGGGSFLMRNDNGKFVDVSEQAGIYGSLISFGLGVTVGDVNGDYYPDIYVSNDFFERDYLYINQRDGTFRDELEQRVQHTSLASMGADLADINNDGYPDIFTTDMLPGDDKRLKSTTSFEGYDVYQYKLRQGFYHQLQQNTLQVNDRTGRFLETAFFSGVAASDWSWGALVTDFDNDGLSDIYVCNGIYKDVIDQDFIDFFANDVIQKMVLSGQKKDVQQIVDSMPSVPLRNKLFRNTGDLKFTDEGEQWGFTDESFSNGAAYGDLDNDGDLDMIVNNVNMPAFVYRNNSLEMTGNNYLAINLKGKGQNRFAVGSIIRVFSGNEIISREVIPSRGFQSSIDYRNIIGLGKRVPDSMHIIWPNRTITRVIKPETNKIHEVLQPVLQEHLDINDDVIVNTLYSAEQFGFEKHVEDPFVDFYSERNIPVMLSREGPRAATADVNGDKLVDIFVGGAKGQAGQLYIQNKKGFNRAIHTPFEQDKESEDVACTFFDADGDGDQDLFVGAGGNNQPPRSKLMLHRLYINNGKGKFSKDSAAFPSNDYNISVAAPHDFDEDGDIDLFVGGRNISYNYGPDPRSYIYVNDGKGKFSDATGAMNPALEKPGLVTDAVWVDTDNDSKKELVIVGEWMSPRIFGFQNGRFVERKTGLEEFYGWWQTINTADLDGDGDNDLVLGNLGENFYLRPDEQNPVKLWINDFDGNGMPDKIFSRTVNGQDVPVFLKKDFTDALPSYKKQNLRHSAFAERSIQTLFAEPLVKNASVKKFNFSGSCIAINFGKGTFSLRKLPYMAQLSCINAILCEDVNDDGFTDLIVGGNNTTCLPQFGRLDASMGRVLLNDGKAMFAVMETSRTGFMVPGMTKEIISIGQGKEKHILFFRNDDDVLVYKKSQQALNTDPPKVIAKN